MKLKLSELASIAEVIGAVAIVISLIYVGVQVTDSTQAVRSASANETSAALSSSYIQLGTNQQASQVFRAGVSSPESLSQDELFQYIMQLHGLFFEYQAAYYLAQEGTLDVDLQEAMSNTILGVRDQPGFQLYWGQRRELFKADFREYVDRLLADGRTNTNMERIYQPRGPE